MSEKIFVVIPTYNESNNIKKIIDLIFGLNLSDLHILIVDDNSPDKTGEIVEALKNRYLNLDILHRTKKEGLGPAYIAGFKLALGNGAQYIIQMDADLSHDPKYIPALLQAVKKSDVALGSRYVAGGGVSNWNYFRRLVSKFGNIYARTILRLSIKDVTGGFRCYNRNVLETINLQDVSSRGFNFQIEVIYKTVRRGFSVVEVPIIFCEREGGKSKFSFKIMLESFYRVFLLRFKK